MKKTRINKHLAETGIASRRSADLLISRGEILVNGIVAKIGQTIDPDKDIVTLKQSNNVTQEQKIYGLYYKKVGETTEEALLNLRANKEYSNITFVGRLEKDVAGILLATNDGRISRAFAARGKDVEKEYHVTTDKPLTYAFLANLKRGVTLHRISGKPPRLKQTKFETPPFLVKKIERNQFDIILFDEKNENIRELCSAFGFKAKRIERFRIGILEAPKTRGSNIYIIPEKDMRHMAVWAGFSI